MIPYLFCINKTLEAKTYHVYSLSSDNREGGLWCSWVSTKKRNTERQDDTVRVRCRVIVQSIDNSDKTFMIAPFKFHVHMRKIRV